MKCGKSSKMKTGLTDRDHSVRCRDAGQPIRLRPVVEPNLRGGHAARPCEDRQGNRQTPPRGTVSQHLSSKLETDLSPCRNPRVRRLHSVCTGCNLCRPSESCAELAGGPGIESPRRARGAATTRVRNGQAAAIRRDNLSRCSQSRPATMATTDRSEPSVIKRS
jgi:hypothetical protein